MNLGSKNMRGISWPAEESISFSRMTLLHGISRLYRKKCTLLVSQNERCCWDTVWYIQVETYRHQQSNLKLIAWFFSHRWNKCLIYNKKILKVLPYPLDCADHRRHLNGQHLHSILHFPLLYLQLLFCLPPACREQPEGEDLGLGLLSNGNSNFTVLSFYCTSRIFQPTCLS